MLDSLLLHGGDSGCGVFLDGVCNQEGAGVLTFHSQIHDGSDFVHFLEVHRELLHQAGIPGQHFLAVNGGLDSVSGDFVIGGDPVFLDCLAISFLDGIGNRVAGISLGMGSYFEQLFRTDSLLGFNRGDFELPLGQGTGLIHHHVLQVIQAFQVVAALHEDPFS